MVGNPPFVRSKTGYRKKEVNMEERIIILKDANTEDFIIVNTNAPQEEIQKALIYMNETRAQGLFEYLCDFEIVQNYLEDRNYFFCESDTREEYYW
jgi:hypothetical protein